MKRTRIKTVLVSCLLLLVSTGCFRRGYHRRSISANYSNPIRTVAVLPMINNTNDIEGAQFVRKMFYKELPYYHYEVKPLKKVDQILNLQMGITLGEQLGLTTAQKLGETLGVDGVFYGYLINFEDTITAVYNVRYVRMGWKLVDTKTGEIVWGKGVGVKQEIIGGEFGDVISDVSKVKNFVSEDEVDPMPTSKKPMEEMPGISKWIVMATKNKGSVGKALVGSLFNIVVSNISGTHLKAETNFAINKLFSGSYNAKGRYGKAYRKKPDGVALPGGIVLPNIIALPGMLVGPVDNPTQVKVE